MVYKKLLEQKSVSATKSHLKFELAKANLNFEPHQALTAAIYAGKFIWECKDLLFNFSIFLCTPLVLLGGSNIMSGENNNLTLQVQSLEGNGLKHEHMSKVLKYECSSSTQVQDALDQLQNFLSLTSLTFANQTNLTKALSSWFTHMMCHNVVYQSFQ